MRTFLVVPLFLAFAAFSCRDGAESVSPAPTPPSPPATAQTQVIVAAGNAFSIDFFRSISAAEPGTNVFVSPLSASMALGMTLNGAEGSTYDSMRAVLGFGTLTRDDINLTYKSLAAYLQAVDQRVTVDIANSIWYRLGFPVERDFIAVNRDAFNAEVAALDFSSVNAVPTINGWVNEKTRGKIPTIIDDIAPDVVMYLINALYFKGMWTTQFDKTKTREEVFNITPQQPVPCQMMHLHATFAYGTSAGATAIDLPYGNRRYSMTVILPPTTVSVDAFAASLTQNVYNALIASMDSAEVELSLPKFRIEYKRTLNSDLIGLGMGIAFDPGRANFHRINATEQLYISKVLQKAYVGVDEEGTEAAAVTVVEIRVTSVPTIPVFRADRPFLFVIREHETGAILFIGKVTGEGGIFN